jgi:hypothetical protein
MGMLDLLDKSETDVRTSAPAASCGHVRDVNRHDDEMILDMTPEYVQLPLFDTAPYELNPSARPFIKQRIDCPRCDMAAAELVNGALIIRSRHHGRYHVTAVSLEKLKTMIENSI